MTRRKVAVIGVGHLGRIHARLLKSLDEVELVGVVDIDRQARDTVATQLGVCSAEHVSAFDPPIEAAIVATPTATHQAVASELIQRGIHVLVEKPITPTVSAADELIRSAALHQRVLQIGHVERFNPAWQTALPYLAQPRYIEARRCGRYTFRSTDVGAVLDMMIHDIDLVLSLVDAPVRQISAVAEAIVGEHEDMAQARIEFENGCIANLFASRCSSASERIVTAFGLTAHVAIDLGNSTVQLIQPINRTSDTARDAHRHAPAGGGPPPHPAKENVLHEQSLEVTAANAILNEQREFLAAVNGHGQPRVTGEVGREALIVASDILVAAEQHAWRFGAAEDAERYVIPAESFRPSPGTAQRKAG